MLKFITLTEERVLLFWGSLRCVTQLAVETRSTALWEMPGSLVHNEVNESDRKDKQVKPHQEEQQVSARVLNQEDENYTV